MGYGDGFFVKNFDRGDNPVSYYYGKDQTKRVGENYTPASSGDSSPAEFKTTADETYNGGKSDLLIVSNGIDEPNIDLAMPPDKCVIQFPIGRYHLLFQGYSAARSRADFRIELKKILEGTDDIIITHTTGWTSAVTPAEKAYIMVWKDFVVVNGTEKFYWLFPVEGDLVRSHFLRVEKVV